MNTVWKGAIAFGLVTVPVMLKKATEAKETRFRQVHAGCGGRIRQERHCLLCEKVVEFGELTKGLEVGEGMVEFTDEELAQLPLPTTRVISVEQFIPAPQLDPMLVAGGLCYYVEPEAIGGRAYVLLRDALVKSGKVGVCKLALRKRESLAALTIRDGVLVLTTMLWPDEVRHADFGFLTDETLKARPQELKMALSLVESMTADFDASLYTDDYGLALQSLVESKLKGKAIVATKAKAPARTQDSLASALQASLEAAKPKTPAPRARATARKPAAKATRPAVRRKAG